MQSDAGAPRGEKEKSPPPKAPPPPILGFKGRELTVFPTIICKCHFVSFFSAVGTYSEVKP